MPRFLVHPRARRTLVVFWAILLTATLLVPSASAHAELRQSSPAAGETVGGAIHSITLQFFDLDTAKPQDAQIFDAAGTELAGQLNREDQRLVIALVDPITTPGEYLVTFAVNGIDGDFSEESFTFQWQEGAPEPAGIDVDLAVPRGFDIVTFLLLIAGALIAAFIVQRFLSALKEHRAAQAAPELQ